MAKKRLLTNEKQLEWELPDGRRATLKRVWTSPEYLAVWLNEPSSDHGQARAKKRILRLIELIHHALALKRKREIIVGEMNELQLIRDAAARYVGVPDLSISAALGEQRLDFEYQPKRAMALDEWNAFSFVASLLKQRKMLRLRRCQFSGCRRWYLAARDHQKYCPKPARCKRLELEQSPKFKAERKKYMKKYYAEVLSTNSARRRAGLKTKPKQKRSRG